MVAPNLKIHSGPTCSGLRQKPTRRTNQGVRRHAITTILSLWAVGQTFVSHESSSLVSAWSQGHCSFSRQSRPQRSHGSLPCPRQGHVVCRLASQPPEFLDDDISRLKAKAMLELEKARAKLHRSQEVDDEMPSSSTSDEEMTEKRAVPFFASVETSDDESASSEGRREAMIKAVDQDTGLVTADGEKMAALSEKEEWQVRSLLEVFENELNESDGDVYSLASKQLAERDVAASIWNLRKELQMEDYKKIFDAKNRFIGETE